MTNPHHLLQYLARVVGCLQSEIEDGVVEGVWRVLCQIRVGIALDHGKATRHARVDVLLR